MDDLAAQIVKQVPIVEIIGRYTDLTHTGGDEYTGLCPFHQESNPSFSVNKSKGLYHCFSCGASGNVINFVRNKDNLSFPDACKKLAGEQGIATPKKARKKPALGKIVKTYDYKDKDGNLAYQVVRYEPKTFRQRRKNESGEWVNSVRGVEPLPYRLPELLARPDATVLIVEGEKDADLLAEQGFTVTTNSGGAGKWNVSLNQYFQGRHVAVIADRDPQTLNKRTGKPMYHDDGRPVLPGKDHAEAVCRSLSEVAASRRLIMLPGPDKSDVSDWFDAGGTADKLKEIIRSTEIWQDYEAQYSPPPPPPDYEEAPEPGDVMPAQFRALGFAESNYYYFPYKKKQIYCIPGGAHTSPAHLLSLASLEFWESVYPAASGKTNWTAVANACIRWCENVGPFNDNMIRGRGAWFDDGRAVMHFGDRLLVNNSEVMLNDMKSKFIYEMSPPLDGVRLGPPLDDATGGELKTVVDLLRWEKSTDGLLLIGFCFLATVCGALGWRPHLWLTGTRGSGKSWLLNNIVIPLLGDVAVLVQASTSEAGIRQSLRRDALPVIFDESESETAKSRSRLQEVIDLARQASSESNAYIAKGTVSGRALAYKIRSMFLLSSTNIALARASDVSRFSVLTLKAPAKGSSQADQFRELDRKVREVLTQDFCESFRSRAYQRIPDIRRNAEIFARAIAVNGGTQREGDQIGTLLAGAYTALWSEPPTIEHASGMVLAYQDDVMSTEEDIQPDEIQLLHHVLAAQLLVTAFERTRRLNIMELVKIATGTDAYDISPAEAKGLLERHGIKPESAALVFSNSHSELRSLLRETPWEGGWSRLFLRLPGAARVSTAWFAGLRHRGVRIPFDTINS